MLPAELAAVIAEAEAAIADLNRMAEDSPAFQPLTRFLLRSQSIASARIEGLQVDIRGLARAEVAQETGRSVGSHVAEVLVNIDAMSFAIERAADEPVGVDGIRAFYHVLTCPSPTPSSWGRSVSVRTGSGERLQPVRRELRAAPARLGTPPP